MRWPTGGPRPDKLSRDLHTGGKRTGALAQIFDTHVPPRAGCAVSTAGVTRRLRGERQVVVGDCDFPECFTRCSSTWARYQSCTNPVEASHPRFERYCTNKHTLHHLVVFRQSGRLARQIRKIRVVGLEPSRDIVVKEAEILLEDPLDLREALHLMQLAPQVG